MKSIKAATGTKILPLLTAHHHLPLKTPRSVKSMRSSRLQYIVGKRCCRAASTTSLSTAGAPAPPSSLHQLHLRHPIAASQFQHSRSSFIHSTAPPPAAPISRMSNLPSARLLARAFHRVPAIPAVIQQQQQQHIRQLSTTLPRAAWTGRQPEENSARGTDTHNVQQDAVREGKQDRADSNAADGLNKSGATSGKDVGGQADKAKKESPEAPGPVIGMNDERGGKGAN